MNQEMLAQYLVASFLWQSDYSEDEPVTPVALVLTTAIIALLVGWALDRHRYTTVLQKEITEHDTENVNIQSAWTRSALAGNTLRILENPESSLRHNSSMTFSGFGDTVILSIRRPAVAIMKATGTIANGWPRRLRTPTTWRLRKPAGASGEWHRWATAAVLNWKLSQHADRIPSIHIHGDRDATFPIRYTSPDMVIHGGCHVLPLTHSAEIAEKLWQVAA